MATAFQKVPNSSIWRESPTCHQIQGRGKENNRRGEEHNQPIEISCFLFGYIQVATLASVKLRLPGGIHGQGLFKPSPCPTERSLARLRREHHVQAYGCRDDNRKKQDERNGEDDRLFEPRPCAIFLGEGFMLLLRYEGLPERVADQRHLARNWYLVGNFCSVWDQYKQENQKLEREVGVRERIEVGSHWKEKRKEIRLMYGRFNFLQGFFTSADPRR
jgi:hypothetical protein